MVKITSSSTPTETESITVKEALSLLRSISGITESILIEDGRLVIDQDQHRAVQMHFRQKINGLEVAMGAIPSVAEPEYRPIHNKQVGDIHDHIRDLRRQRNEYMAFYEVRP